MNTPEEKIEALDEQIRHLIHHRERLKNDIDRLECRLQKIGDEMEKIVVTEGEDAGVVLLSADAPTHRRHGLSADVYDLEYFSPLGEALMRVYNISKTSSLLLDDQPCSRCDGPGGAVTFANQACVPIEGKVQCIDWCIHHIVAALTAGGVETVASCCGHGTQRGRIDLKDGRILWIDEGARRCPPATGLVVSASPADSTVVAPPHLSIPDRDKLRMIRDVPLQEGDWAVESSNPGHFLKVHPDQFGKPASGSAYSFFRENAIGEARADNAAPHPPATL